MSAEIINVSDYQIQGFLRMEVFYGYVFYNKLFQLFFFGGGGSMRK